MESELSDIAPPPVKSIFESLFRRNVLMVITFVIIANGYSNIPGVSELLTKLFASHFNRFIITFILFFQIIDNIRDTFIWTCIVTFALYVIEQEHIKRNKNKNIS